MATFAAAPGEAAASRRSVLPGLAVYAAIALSAGFIVVEAGYSAAFLFLAAVAAIGLGLFTALMPETGPRAVPLRTSNPEAPRVF